MRKNKEVNIVKLQLVLDALKTALTAENVHINSKSRIVDLIEKIYQDIKNG